MPMVASASSGVAPGRHRLCVTVPFPLRSRTSPDRDRRRDERDHSAAGGGQLRPRIVDAEGAAIAGARVQVTRLDGGGLCWELSGRDGAVHLAGLLPDGWYGLEIYPPEGRIDMRALELEAWRPSDQPIVLEPAQVIRGRV